MFKETDRTALLWGTIIGVGLVAGVIVSASYFPNFRLPFSDTGAESSIVTVFLFVGLVASYRKLWKRAGFWALMAIFLVGSTAFYWLVFPKFVGAAGGLQTSLIYGMTGGAAFLLVALAILRIYHRGPKLPKWLRAPR